MSQLLTADEVARLFAVDGRTVAKWARNGRLPAVRTLGGHYRFRPEDLCFGGVTADDVRAFVALLAAESTP